MATFLENLRDALIDADVKVREPRVKAAGKHPLWLEPRGGAIAPGEVENADEDDDDLVLSAFRFPGVATARHEGDTFRYDNVEIRFRCQRPPDAYALEEEVRAILHDRRNWDMGELRIIESLIYLELSPLGSSSEQGFTFRIEYSFQRYLTPQP